MPRLAAQMVDRARLERQGGAIEAALAAPAQAESRRRLERRADDMLEQGPVAVPADAGARIVTDHQRVDEIFGRKTGKGSSPFPQGEQEIGDRLGRIEGGGVEIIAPP